MTRENAKALLPIIEAYANGETIQFLARGKDIWEDLDHPSFLPGEQYRIKPKSREWWLVETDIAPGRIDVWTTEPRQGLPTTRITHVIEAP